MGMLETHEPKARMEIGPDRSDLRECRPYFLVPMRDLRDQKELSDLEQRIVKAAQAQQTAGQQVTDLYVLSHGWHRNFYTGVAAYDRLVSRLAALMHRRRMTPPTPYYPLFVTLHWHSDPGSDGWVDPAGRRDKTSFMTNVRVAFRPGVDPGMGAETTEAAFANDFESIYELFSSVSAPDTDILDEKYTEAATTGWERLDAYRFRDSDDTLPEASRAEKTAMAWRCYYEALPRRVLLDQNDPPKPYNNVFEALSTLVKFLFSTLGAVTILGFLFKNWKTGESWLTDFWDWFVGLPLVQPIWKNILLPCKENFLDLSPWAQALVALLLCLFILVFTAGRRSAKKQRATQRGHNTEGRQARGFPVFTLAAWLPLQIVCALPMLVWAIFGYLLGGLLSWPYTARGKRAPFVFDERYDVEDRKRNIRDLLAGLARGPLCLFQAALPRDSKIRPLADGLDNQLAFWEMQRKGVNVGRQSGEFLSKLLAHPSLQNVRVHMVAHSFGALVVTNAAKYMAEAQPADKPALVDLQTVCLIQGALASDWFVDEARLLAYVRGKVACIYSGYDTANGFYYPLSNNGRMAAGYVGLYRVGENVTPLTLGEGGLFASLVVPPNLSEEIETASKRTGIPWKHALNLDASRLIYKGSPAAGGGHDDIYKDDVIHLLWAVTTELPPGTAVRAKLRES